MEAVQADLPRVNSPELPFMPEECTMTIRRVELEWGQLVQIPANERYIERRLI
jgi:hypothetical protein